MQYRLILTAGVHAGSNHNWGFLADTRENLQKLPILIDGTRKEIYRNVTTGAKPAPDILHKPHQASLKSYLSSIKKNVKKSERAIFLLTHGSFLRVHFSDVRDRLVDIFEEVGGIDTLTLIACNGATANYEHNPHHDDNEQAKLVAARSVIKTHQVIKTPAGAHKPAVTKTLVVIKKDPDPQLDDIRFDAASFLALGLMKQGGDLCRLVRGYTTTIRVVPNSSGTVNEVLKPDIKPNAPKLTNRQRLGLDDGDIKPRYIKVAPGDLRTIKVQALYKPRHIS